MNTELTAWRQDGSDSGARMTPDVRNDCAWLIIACLCPMGQTSRRVVIT